MNQSFLNNPQSAHPKANQGDGLVPPQNEKKIGNPGLQGLNEWNFKDKKHDDPVQKGRPHCQLIKGFYAHIFVSE